MVEDMSSSFSSFAFSDWWRDLGLGALNLDRFAWLSLSDKKGCGFSCRSLLLLFFPILCLSLQCRSSRGFFEVLAADTRAKRVEGNEVDLGLGLGLNLHRRIYACFYFNGPTIILVRNVYSFAIRTLMWKSLQFINKIGSF